MNDDLEAIDGLCAKIIEQRDRIEALEAALREAEWLLGELEIHEGAEGWSQYLRERLEAYKSPLAPEQDK